MKENSRSVVASRTWLSKALLVTQVAVSVVLLIGAGLFVRTLQNLQSVDVGFTSSNILMFRINPALNRYAPERMTQLYRADADGHRGAARRATVSLHAHGAAVGQHQHDRHLPPGRDHREGRQGLLHHVGVAEVLRRRCRFPVLRGRDFNERDVANPTASVAHQRDGGEEVLPERGSNRPARRPVAGRERADRRSSASSATPSTTACATRRRRPSTPRSGRARGRSP